MDTPKMLFLEKIQSLTNELDLLKQSLEEIKNYLNSLNIPLKDSEGNFYSVINRIEYLLNSLRD